MTKKSTKKVLLLGLCSTIGLSAFAQFSGDINVGSGQTYTSLTNTNGLFNAINSGTVSGNITVKITSDLIAETGAIALNKWAETGTGNYKLTIIPDGTSERLIRGKAENLITLNGAANVSINGNPTNNGNKYLRFRNDSTSTTGIITTLNFVNDAKLDTLQNCFVEGAGFAVGSGVITLGSSTGTNGNDSIAILNNIVRDVVGTVAAAGSPNTLLLNNNTGSTKNDNIIISGNQFSNWTNAAIYLQNSGNKIQILNNACYITTGFRANIVYGIYVATTGGNGHIISGNSIGGSTATRGGTAAISTSSFNAIYQISTVVGDTTVISNNTIGNLRGVNVYGVYNMGTVKTNIYSNIIGGVATGYSDTLSATSGTINGVYSEGAGNIANNQIRRLKSATGNATGIYLTNVANVVVDNNTIDSVIGSRGPNISNAPTPAGIQIAATIAGGSPVVSNNTISNIGNLNTNATSLAGVSGIQIGGASSPVRVFNNKISAIFGANANPNGTNVAGIYDNATTQDSIYNNQIILGDRALPTTWLKGLVVASNSLTVPSFYFNNSVYIKNNGNTPYNNNVNSNFLGVQAFYRTYNSPVYLKNNIFYNVATNAGTAMVAAIYTNSTTNWYSDYNLCYTVDTSKLNYIGSTPVGYGLQAWKTVALSDTNSLSAVVPFASATDLHINTADAAAWNIFGRGIAVATNTTDIDNNLRSTTIGTPVCIGFDELTSQPSVVPADLIMTPAIAVLGTPTVFTSAGRKIAEITWTGTTVPTSLSAKYYPGLQAPAATSTPNTNSYFDVTATPDNGSPYTIKIYYTTAEANGIADNILKGIKKHAANNYVEISNTGANASDVNGKYITSNTLTDFSIFSLTGSTTPLAITLTDISATNVHQSNRINWKTATEGTSDIFELERSIDGKNFDRIAVVAAKGEPGAYTYWDNAAVTGKNYYRIKLSQQNEQVLYSNVVTATVAAIQSFVISAYPNPANGTINIHVDGDIHANAKIQVVSMTGNVLKTSTISTKETGIDIHDLPTGNYILHYSDDTQHVSFKMNKE